MRRREKIRTVVVAAAVLLGLARAALSATTDEEQCLAGKLKAAGKYGQCRMTAEATATRRGNSPDFSRCDAKLANTFLSAETKYGAACPTVADAAAIEDQVESDARDLTCALRGYSESDRASVIVVPNVDVSEAHDVTLSLRNASNMLLTAYCFYSSASTCSVSDFVLEIPPREAISWSASWGAFAGVPPVPAIPFAGELVCVQVAADLLPVNGNALVASITEPDQCRVGGIAVVGDPMLNDADPVLTFGTGLEYGPCPIEIETWRIESCWSGSMFTFQCN